MLRSNWHDRLAERTCELLLVAEFVAAVGLAGTVVLAAGADLVLVAGPVLAAVAEIASVAGVKVVAVVVDAVVEAAAGAVEVVSSAAVALNFFAVGEVVASKGSFLGSREQMRVVAGVDLAARIGLAIEAAIVQWMSAVAAVSHSVSRVVIVQIDSASVTTGLAENGSVVLLTVIVKMMIVAAA